MSTLSSFGWFHSALQDQKRHSDHPRASGNTTTIFSLLQVLIVGLVHVDRIKELGKLLVLVVSGRPALPAVTATCHPLDGCAESVNFEQDFF